ncbi:MAG: ATP-grasp domain-containing protein [Deltaproteobacteria bacterium]|nr:ATP-grasp domain-containing protein [Deltaproteobacteria bacterium]
MRVGITYDLRNDYLDRGFTEEETAEFDHVDTIDAIDGALLELGHETVRIGNVRRLASRLVAGERWDMVFNIAEGLRGFGREAQAPALLDAYDIPYTFSDPLVLSLTLHKALTKRVIRDLGLPTPEFRVVEEESDAVQMDLPFPLFAKPVAEGTGKGINTASKIRGKDELVSVCRDLLQTYRQPVLVESFLPGRELTVGVLGTGAASRVLGVMEVILKSERESGWYSYHEKENWRALVSYRLASDVTAVAAAETALALWRGIGGRDGGRIDLRADDKGVPNLLEVNPLAGLHPGHSDLCLLADLTGMSYVALIGEIMNSASARISGAGFGPGERGWTTA